MSNMLPMTGSGFGPGGKGDGGRLSVLMISHTMAPEKNTVQIITVPRRKRALVSDITICNDQAVHIPGRREVPVDKEFSACIVMWIPTCMIKKFAGSIQVTQSG